VEKKMSVASFIPNLSLGMFGLSGQELLIVLIIVLIVFGGSKLPKLGTGLGKSIKNFKKSMNEEDDTAKTTEQASPTTVVQVEVQRPESLEAGVTEAEVTTATVQETQEKS
jgi:sec-independent protein translocase protein TatA